ncbi:MAG: WYL domain-containing protein [Actinobacteria bacterium]|nr:WYL domain-containing protein [Actinomycetota bacterium]
MSPEDKGRLGRRLGRILVLLPYAIRNPGISVDELAQRFGIARRELIDDLNLIFLCGLPGYGPGDLIDVSLEEDRVYVDMADYFSLPLRLTPAEALALYAGGEAIAALPGMEEAEALRRALGKLGLALGTDGADGASGIKVELDYGPQAHLESIQHALHGRRRLWLEYFSASRGEMTRRTVDPWGLVAALGRWYLVAYDHRSQDERMFRTDRIKSVDILDEPADVPTDFDPDEYRGAWSGSRAPDVVAFEISPAAERWFKEYYPVTSSSLLEDGWSAVEIATNGDAWAATLLLRLGKDARNVRPQAVVDHARRLAASLAQRHGYPGDRAPRGSEN